MAPRHRPSPPGGVGNGLGRRGAAPPRLIHLMDREGDVYEVLQWVEEVGDSAIIRCVQNRRVDAPLRLGHAAVRAQPVLGRVTLTVPRSHGKPARPATVEMRALTTTLCPDRKKYPHAWPLTWTLVEVWEPTPAPAYEALHWLLWTREPATTLVEVQEVVRKYTCRWPIEEYLDAEERLSYRGPPAGKVGQFGKGDRDVHQRGCTHCRVAGPGGTGAGRPGHGVAE